MWYNHYQFAAGDVFVKCPRCDSKLVIDYDFNLSTKVTDYASDVCLLTAFAVVTSSLVWGFKEVGVYFMFGGMALGIPLYLLGDFIRNPEAYETKKTRVFKENVTS